MIRHGIPEAPRAGASAIADAPVAGLVFDDVPRPGEILMARDEARFLAAERSSAPVEASLTWFAWERPTLSLGRLEPPEAFDPAALRRAGIPCVVRPTGGVRSCTSTSGPTRRSCRSTTRRWAGPWPSPRAR